MPAKDVDSTDPMTYRKDDHVVSEGPGEGYEQKITRTSADGRSEEVYYFDRGGKELPEGAIQKGGKPGRAADPKPGVPEHKPGGGVHDRH